jgi:hypothetical protein
MTSGVYCETESEEEELSPGFFSFLWDGVIRGVSCPPSCQQGVNVHSPFFQHFIVYKPTIE